MKRELENAPGDRATSHTVHLAVTFRVVSAYRNMEMHVTENILEIKIYGLQNYFTSDHIQTPHFQNWRLEKPRTAV